MSNEPQKQSQSQNQEQTPNPDEQAIDPRDLVNKGGLPPDQDPQEIVNNPAVTPQMINEPGDLRSDLRRE